MAKFFVAAMGLTVPDIVSDYVVSALRKKLRS